jgi:hypothetical protein
MLVAQLTTVTIEGNTIWEWAKYGAAALFFFDGREITRRGTFMSIETTS